MSLYNAIIETYPELANSDIFGINGEIKLRNDADENGDYIEKWNYHKPLPEGLKVGK